MKKKVKNNVKVVLGVVIVTCLFISIGCRSKSADFEQIVNAKNFLTRNRVLLDSVVLNFKNVDIPFEILRRNPFSKDSVYYFAIDNHKRFEYNINFGGEKFLKLMETKINVNTLNSLMSSIFKLCQSVDIYAIFNGPDSMVEFMLNSKVESVYYLSDLTQLKPERVDDVIFKHLEDHYYYYYIPR